MYKSLLDYYNIKKINPVPINIYSKKKFKHHFLKRANLIENHLKIPLNSISCKSILDIGCNTGENSIVLAHLDANLTLVEASKNAIKKCLLNFKKFNLLKKIKSVKNLSIENYNTNKKFDIIIAEGFLNTLDNREKILEKLFSFLKKDGKIIINFDCLYGGFLELYKSCLFLRICKLKKIDLHSKSALKLAKKLFLKSFKQLNPSRNFEAWFKDQLVNPYAAYVWSYEDLLKIANKNNMICFSTSPDLYKIYQQVWYKDINYSSSTKKINSNFIKSWEKNFFYIMTGKKQIISKDNFFNFSGKKYKNFFYIKNSLRDSSLAMSKYIKNYPNYEINTNFMFLKENFFYQKSNINNKKLFNEMFSNMNLLNSTKDYNKLIQSFLKSKILQYSWGTLLHYVVFVNNKRNT